MDFLHERVARHARTIPNRVAVRDPSGAALTYADVDALARRVAGGVVAAGVAPGGFVLVSTRKSVHFAPTIVGVLRAGAVPVLGDPRASLMSVAWALASTGASHVVSDGDAGPETFGTARILTLETLLGHAPHAEPLRGPYAYVVLTSGTSGAQKAIGATHQNLQAFIDLVPPEIRSCFPRWHVSFSLPSFDAVVEDCLMPLWEGESTLMLDASRLDGASVRLLSSVEIGHAAVTPSMVPALARVLGRATRFRKIDRLVLGGEDVTGEQLRLARETLAVQVFNSYGPSEATVCVTYHRLQLGRPITLGDAHPPASLSIVDDRGEGLPDGEIGEIVIAGPSVVPGYLGAPAFSQLTFRRLADGSYRYRTGDRGRKTPDGIVFHGRLDTQVKIHGVRLELGQVEAIAEREPGVLKAAAVLDPERKTLDLFLHAATDDERTRTRVRERLRETLPPSVIVAAVHHVAEMPLTPSGKVDLRTLAGRVVRTKRRLELSPVESRIGKAWSELLGVPLHELSADSDFFVIGGNSLAAAALVLMLRGEGFSRAELRTIIEAPVLAELAARLGGAVADADLSAGSGATVRVARMADYRDLRRICSATSFWARRYNAPWLAANLTPIIWLGEFFRDPDCARFVLEQDGAIIGYLIGSTDRPKLDYRGYLSARRRLPSLTARYRRAFACGRSGPQEARCAREWFRWLREGCSSDSDFEDHPGERVIFHFNLKPDHAHRGGAIRLVTAWEGYLRERSIERATFSPKNLQYLTDDEDARAIIEAMGYAPIGGDQYAKTL